MTPNDWAIVFVLTTSLTLGGIALIAAWIERNNDNRKH